MLWLLVGVVLVLALVARRLARPLAQVALVGLAVVVLVSLAYSVHATTTEPASAYFVTPTRVWELGAGGLLAVLVGRHGLRRGARDEAVPWPGGARALLAWAGLAAIVGTAFVYSSATPFPGWQALLPVLGTAAVIAANAPRAAGSPAALMAWGPVQRLGDISYSVYLWHWPLVVLLPYASGGALGLLDKGAIVLATLGLAVLTKRFVEDRFRAPGWGRPLRKPYAWGAVGMAFVIALATLQLVEVDRRADQARVELDAAIDAGDPCFGAAALAPGADCPRTVDGPVVPAPAQALEDKSEAYSDVSGGRSCWSSSPRFRVVRCDFGPQDADVTVALAGNSHAGHWLPALQGVAEARGWRITTFLASQCALADVSQLFDTDAKSARCRSWGEDVTAELASGDYDLVVMSNRISVRAAGADSLDETQRPYARGYARVLERVRDGGSPVVVVRDTPAPDEIVPDCVAENRDDLTACSGQRSDWEPRDPAASVVRAREDDGVVLADLNDRICRPQVCDAAVGGVVVYFDGSHLTATYARTLSPFLAEHLDRALRRR